jgi:FKBP-type peptidyl-prolyl cis-trans isomerase SlpA
VIDFILVHWQNRWYFPAFNFADSAITVGAVMLALDMFKKKAGEPFMTEQVLAEQRIGQNTEVTLHFALRLENGDTVDSTSTKPRRPSRSAMATCCRVSKRIVRFQGRRQAYSEHRAGKRLRPAQPAKRTDHSAFAVPGHGAVEGLLVIFNDAANTELPGVVKAFDDAQVTIDFNHPLAGKTLTFDVKSSVKRSHQAG